MKINPMGYFLVESHSSCLHFDAMMSIQSLNSFHTVTMMMYYYSYAFPGAVMMGTMTFDDYQPLDLSTVEIEMHWTFYEKFPLSNRNCKVLGCFYVVKCLESILKLLKKTSRVFCLYVNICIICSSIHVCVGVVSMMHRFVKSYMQFTKFNSKLE